MSAKAESCIIRCDDDTIRAAFDWHLARYGERKRAWDTPYHVSMWQRAQRAFEHRSQADFDYVYEELRRRWQVFRGSRDYWTSEQTFTSLMACCPELRNRRLAALTSSDIQRLWEVLQSVRDVKRTSNGSSTVAVSKFLHFWNPRLFVIVDDGVIWKWVLAHHWVWEPIRRMRDVTDVAIFGKRQEHEDVVCDLGTYLAVLVWAAIVSMLVRAQFRSASNRLMWPSMRAASSPKAAKRGRNRCSAKAWWRQSSACPRRSASAAR